MEKKSTHIMYGFFTGIAMVIVGLVLYITNMSFKPGMSFVGYLPFLGGIILNGLAFSKANDKNITFANALVSCMKATMIITIVIVVWSVASMYLFPEMKDKAMEVAREQYEKGGMSQEQIDQAISIARKWMNPLLVAGAIFGTLFVGFVFSLLAAAIAPKRPLMPGQMNSGL